jgi:hypothetical protein
MALEELGPQIQLLTQPIAIDPSAVDTPQEIDQTVSRISWPGKIRGEPIARDLAIGLCGALFQQTLRRVCGPRRHDRKMRRTPWKRPKIISVPIAI